MNIRGRKPIIAGNWKLNKLAAEVAPFAAELRSALPAERGCDVVICAPFPLIPAVRESGAALNLGVGAQDVSEHEKGAYTGEVSAAQLFEFGVRYCIVGHSERRSYHGETDFMVNEKAKALLANAITPIICVGESLEQRLRGLTRELVEYQIAAAFSGIPAEAAAACVVAYEPLWAIGTGNTATTGQAQEVCADIRSALARIYDAETAARIRVLYGGSMNAGNACDLLAQPDIDGGLIGGASLKAEDFVAIAMSF